MRLDAPRSSRTQATTSQTYANALTVAARAAQGWDFANALHTALSEGCEDFTTLDADLAKRAAREVAGGAKAKPVVTKL